MILSSWFRLSSVDNLVRYNIFCAALAAATYSASSEEAAVHVCFLEIQFITLFLSRKIFSDTDFRSLRSLAQSESAYALKTGFSIFV